MRKLKFELDRQFLETIYLTFIRPVLEYANVIWDNCTHYEKEELEKMQNEAARIGTTKLLLFMLFMKKQAGILLNRDVESKNTLFHKMNQSNASLSTHTSSSYKHSLRI